MHHETHGHDSGAEAAGAASWLVAMVLFVVLAVAVIIALFAWAPWNDSDTTGGGTDIEFNNPPDQQNPDQPNTNPQNPQPSP
jgi:hypothetical protein